MGSAILVLHLAALFACFNGISTAPRQGSMRLACPGLKCLPEAGHRGSWWGRRRSCTRATGSDLLLAASGLTRLRGGCTDASGVETGSPGEADVAEDGDDDGAAEVLAEGGEHADPARPEEDAKAEVSREPEVEKTEGQAKFHFKKGEVFYNKAQVVNRDLSVLVISAFVETRQKEMQEERERKMRNREAAAAAAEVIGNPDTVDGPAGEGESVDAAAGGGSVKVVDQDPIEGEGHANATSTRANAVDAPPGREEGATRESGDGLGKPRGVRILDALSATGLRAIRYTLEVSLQASFPLTPSVSLPLHPSALSLLLFLHPSIHPSIHPFHPQSIHPPIYPSTHLSFSRSKSLPRSLPPSLPPSLSPSISSSHDITASAQYLLPDAL